jgi:hypothetical protein
MTSFGDTCIGVGINPNPARVHNWVFVPIMSTTTAFEQHYSIPTLAKMWGWSHTKVRPWFEDEPGCLVEEHRESMHKRGYKSVRVPHSVALRVYARHVSG